jgi:hypothetical protein
VTQPVLGRKSQVIRHPQWYCAKLLGCEFQAGIERGEQGESSTDVIVRLYANGWELPRGLRLKALSLAQSRLRFRG